MIGAADLAPLQSLIAGADLDGWLLFDFRGCNRVTAAVLGTGIVGTRRLYALIPARGRPVALVHAIDWELWRDAPVEWERRMWVTREELSAELGGLLRGKTVAAEYSPGGAIPYLDAVPGGVLEQLRRAGATTVCSADLVTRWCSVWTDADRTSHERAAAIVAAIAQEAIALAGEHACAERPMREYDLARWIRKCFDHAGLVTESGPCVSWGANAARNHYDPGSNDSLPIVRGALLLVDLWAREPGGIYADQTWMASIGAPSERDAGLWQVVREARDAALDLIRARVRAGEAVRGAEADAAARRVIAAAGHLEHTQSRTGHSIDRYGLHGFGPPIDDTETYDDRLLIPGVGFSVEPGVYLLGETGVRSEVNVVVTEGDIVVTPDRCQSELLIVGV